MNLPPAELQALMAQAEQHQRDVPPAQTEPRAGVPVVAADAAVQEEPVPASVGGLCARERAANQTLPPKRGICCIA